MGIEENNKELIRDLYQLYNRHDVDAANELFSPDFHIGDFTREQNKQLDNMLHSAFPDLKITILDMIAEGDKVAYVVNATGTHTGGPCFGVQPTGRKIDMTNTWIVRIVDNKIVEINGTGDTFSQFQQLGVLPSLPEAIQAYNDSLK